MGESRSHADNASASSEDSNKPPPRLEPSKLKSGPGALPPDAFDPLTHNEIENFWHQVDYHFHPINQENVRNLRALPVNPYNGIYDRDIRLPSLTETETKGEDREGKREVKREPKREKNIEDSGKRPSDRVPSVKIKSESTIVPHRSSSSDRVPSVKVKSESTLVPHRSSSSFSSEALKSTPADPDSAIMRASLNSFPYTQRLIAALLDENPNGTQTPFVPSKNPNRHAALEDCLWMGAGSEAEIRTYQSALETRVIHELSEKGWLDENHEDSLEAEIRKEQWKLRDVKTANRIRKLTVSKIISTELVKQADRRAKKRQQDAVEMAYLDRLIGKMKKNKKSRTKYQKLLSRMFGHYKDRDKLNEKAKKVAETMGNGRSLVNGDEKTRPSGKKKKKNKSNHDLPTKSVAKGPTRKSAP